ncbi:unnamed protein product [Lactuca virosa]|uniref:Uncharacterized protein n=1 Tax=Lactuca virosa TaxID=75947 RepID=A0AAU9NVS2_9ASTR|nr:unnamed protein product [Lactuca virosa]
MFKKLRSLVSYYIAGDSLLRTSVFLALLNHHHYSPPTNVLFYPFSPTMNTTVFPLQHRRPSSSLLSHACTKPSNRWFTRGNKKTNSDENRVAGGTSQF